MPREELDLLPCPFCGRKPKLTLTQYQISCSNYTSCAVRPRVTSDDLDTARSKWESRAQAPVGTEFVDGRLRDVRCYKDKHMDKCVCDHARTYYKCPSCDEISVFNGDAEKPIYCPADNHVLQLYGRREAR